MSIRLTATLSILMLVLMPALTVTANQSGSTSPCGVWQTKPRPAVAPIPLDKTDAINDGEIDVTQVGDILSGRPTALAIAPDGAVYVAVSYSTTYPLSFSSAIYGTIYMVNDGGSHLLVDGIPFPNGLAFIGDDLYVSQLGGIARIRDVRGATCDSLVTVVDNLPFDDIHQTNGLAYHDGRLYVSQGLVYRPLESSRQDVLGTIFSVEPDGGDLRIEATGFRNPYGIAFDDQGRLWASDNGPNADYDPGVTSEDEVTPDELNLVVPGTDYGFHPLGYELDDATTTASPTASPVSCPESACSTAPALTFAKHVAPAGVTWDSHNQQVLTALSSWGQVVAYDPETDSERSVLWSVAFPTALATGPDDSLYIGEWMTQRVIKVDLNDIAAARQ